MNSSLVRSTPSSSGRLFAAAALSLGLFASASQAATIVLIDATTRNGSFELIAGSDTTLADRAKIATGFDVVGQDVDFWQNASGVFTDSGVQSDIRTNYAQSGDQFAFIRSTDGGVMNLTSYTIQAGDVFTLTWYAKKTGSVAGQQDVRLFGTSDTTFTNSVTLGQVTGQLAGANNGSAYTQYTIGYTAVGGDTGKALGVFFDNITAAATYASFDNFVLTVETAAVPEPSTYAALGGVGALAFAAMRRRRKSVQA